MREEFERINPMPSGVIRCGNEYASTDYGWMSRDYVNAFKAFSAGWKASRAALCVQMPKITDFARDSSGARELLNFEFAVECVARELDDAGVRYE